MEFKIFIYFRPQRDIIDKCFLKLQMKYLAAPTLDYLGRFEDENAPHVTTMDEIRTAIPGKMYCSFPYYAGGPPSQNSKKFDESVLISFTSVAN